MSSDKLENIYKLLTEHNFDANKNVPDKFKCGKCRKVLIEACQTRCGCRFCRSCVDEMMNNGCQFCPGITNDCKNESLSTVVTDFRANKQISKLIMKCPEEMCSFECKLLEMSEHLRICGKKSVECPFYKLGCDVRKMTKEKLIEHFQLENYNHNKTLIDMIDNIRNEFRELKENFQSMEKHMENVKIFNSEIVKSNSEHEKEMQSIKKTMEELNDQMQTGLRNVWYKIDEIELELKKRFEKGKTKSIDDELIRKSEISQKVYKQTIDESMMLMDIKQKINQLERNVENKMNGIFEMMIDKVNELKKKFGPIWSEYFYVRMCPYKLRLSIYPLGDELLIHLCIYGDVMNQYLPFPFKADVTMKIINKRNRELNKSIKKYCQIEKPESNSYKWSDDFIYPYSELLESGIIESNCFIIECWVELKCL